MLGCRSRSSDGGDGSENADAGDDAARVGDILATTGDDDEPIRSPSPKHRQMTRGKPARKRKRIVERTLPTIVLPKEATIQFATDLLVSTLPTSPAQEDIPAHPSSVAGALDVPIPEHTTELPSTSGTRALLDHSYV